MAETLNSLSSEEKLNSYNLMIQGCSHLYSKNSLQKEKALQILQTLIPLTIKDPYWLAHLTSYILKHSQNKDLKIFLTYVNALSTANGEPFSIGSKYKKPNLRYVSAAALQMLDPKLALRVLEIAKLKYSVPSYLNESSHFPTSLRTAFHKYLKYREMNLEITRGIKKAGLGKNIQNMYRGLRLSPSDEVAAILRWQQKDKKITFAEKEFDFKDKTDLEIAETIREKKLPILGVLGALERPMSPVIAVALLEQATGNQAVILRKLFEEQGLLKDKEVFNLYQTKIKEAKTALDRVNVITETASEEVKQVLKQTKADVRKDQVGELGKLFLHIDTSGSLSDVFNIATKSGSIIAEIVKNPKEKFRWGTYDDRGEILPLPEEFIEDAFMAILFGRTTGGGTDAFALYPEARKFGAKLDVHISDGGHNVGNLGSKIKNFHQKNPSLEKPKVCLIIQIPGSEISNALQRGYEENQIPVTVMKPEVLTESALVSSAIQVALVGPLEIINQIMKTELLKLPDYYFAI